MPLTMRMDPGTPPQAGGPGEEDAATRQIPAHRARRCPTCQQFFSGEGRFCPFDGDPLVDAPEWNPAADPLIGKTLDGRYRVVSVLGEGGMGTVYEVRHVALDRRFALKVLRRDVAQDAELTARFIREAKAAAAIGHPHIVAVSDFGEIGGEELPGARGRVPYFVMEFLSGESLATVLGREGTLPSGRAGTLMLQAASALEAAHGAGVIHRDLKPDNVFLDSAGDREFVKLLDFGVAKIAGAGRLTRAGMVYGTPHYMSPEQAAGSAVDHRSDIYALGVIMYECFAGRVPFEADTYMGVLTKHMFAIPEPIERVATDPGCLGALGPIVMRCLEKKPDDRFASMAEVGEAIAQALEDPDRVSVTAVRRDRRQGDALQLREASLPPAARHSVPSEVPGMRPIVGKLALLALATFSVVLVLGIVLWRVTSPAPPAPRSEESARTAAASEPPPASTPSAAVAAPAAPSPPSSEASPEASAKASSEPTAPAPTSRAPRAPGRPPDPAPPAKPSSGGHKPSAKSGDVVDPW